jgi:hypothetical protein
VLPESEEIAESIEEVRGGALAIAPRPAGALDAIVGRVLGGESPGKSPVDLEFRMGSETLREVALVSNIERANLHHPSSESGARREGGTWEPTLVFLLQWLQGWSLRVCRNASRKLVGRSDAPSVNEVALEELGSSVMYDYHQLFYLKWKVLSASCSQVEKSQLYWFEADWEQPCAET